MHEFNKEAIIEQRESKEAANNVLYWTNKKMKQWLNQIDLQVFVVHINSMQLCRIWHVCIHFHVNGVLFSLFSYRNTLKI